MSLALLLFAVQLLFLYPCLPSPNCQTSTIEKFSWIIAFTSSIPSLRIYTNLISFCGKIQTPLILEFRAFYPLHITSVNLVSCFIVLVRVTLKSTFMNAPLPQCPISHTHIICGCIGAERIIANILNS